jgi:hypothetical protein
MRYPAFDNSYDPSTTKWRDVHYSISQLEELNRNNSSDLIDYGKLRCGERVTFYSLRETRVFKFFANGYEVYFITCKRNDHEDFLWLGQFKGKDENHRLIYPQLPEDHYERLACLAEKTLITEDVVSEYESPWDGCVYKYAAIKEIV